MNIIKKIFYIFSYFLLAAFGSSLVIKAGIGQGSFIALQVALANWLGVSVGTIYIILNAFLFLLCLLLDQKRKWIEYFSMLLVILLFGWLTNLFLYGFLGRLILESYCFRLAYFLFGLLIMGASLGRLLKDELIVFPLEKACLLASKQTSWSFVRYRYISDVLCISVALFISFFGSHVFSIREGTVLTMLLLPGILAKFKQ